MPKGVHLKGRLYLRRVRAALGDLLFCVGLTLLPFLAAADLCVWASCRQLDQHGCIQLLANSQVLMETMEFGANVRIDGRFRSHE